MLAPRLVEDLTIKCPVCGEFPGTQMFGARDWLSRQRPYYLDVFHDRTEELSSLIRAAKHEDDDDEGDEYDDEDRDEDDDEGVEGELPPVVTRERIDSEGDDEPWPCERDCDGELPFTWNQLIEGHERLTAAEVRWLESYTRAKELIRLGLFRNRVGFRTAIGLFAVHNTPELSHAAAGTVGAAAEPLFIASAQLARRVGALDPETVMRQLSGDEPCRPTADSDADSLRLPIYFEGPSVTIDVELPLDVSTIADELVRDGSTPLRGFGILRLLDVDWVSTQGKLVYLDFDEGLRETMVAAERGERW